MVLTLSHLEPAPLPIPPRGSSQRYRLGRIELVLEPVRGGFSLLCLDGGTARTWSLGLSGHGELWLQCRLPRWPLRVTLKDTLVLVPHSRVHGYVQVPLVPTLVWRQPGRADGVVAELLPTALSAEWEEMSSAVVLRWSSPFLQRLPLPDELPRGIVPLRVRNDADAIQGPEALPVAVADDELRPCRGHLVASPRRLSLDDRGRITTSVRGRAGEVRP